MHGPSIATTVSREQQLELGPSILRLQLSHLMLQSLPFDAEVRHSGGEVRRRWRVLGNREASLQHGYRLTRSRPTQSHLTPVPDECIRLVGDEGQGRLEGEAVPRPPIGSTTFRDL